jgi:hypothetical protein
MEEMMKNVSAIIVIFMLLSGCGQNTAPDINDDSYTPLNAGDQTQIVFLPDSITQMLRITGIVERSDRQKVYVMESKLGINDPDTMGYYYIKDGYYMSTELNRIKFDPVLAKINPFNEQRLAKSNPEASDMWYHTVGDTDSLYFIADKIDSLDTYCGTFKDVFAFQLFYKNSDSFFMKIYYGKNLGYLATELGFATGPEMVALCSYKKIGNHTYGNPRPEKGPVLDKIKKIRKEYLINLFAAIALNKPITVNGQFIVDK